MDKIIVKKYLIVFTFLLLTVALAGQEAACAPTSPFTLPSPDDLSYKPLRFELPRAQRVVLENGIVLYILENHELPLVHISAMVRTGTMHDPEGKEGVADLTAYVMRTGGTENFSSADMDRQFDMIAASAAITMSMESAQVSFSVLEMYLDRGLELLSQILMYPVFEQEKFDLARQLKIEDVRRIRDDPQRFAFREFNRLLYYDNPRGRFPSMRSLDNIKRDDLFRFHNRFFIPDNIMFAVSGDITQEEVLKKFNHYFGTWKRGETSPALSPPAAISNPGMYLINKDLPQSTIVSGLSAPSKNSPEFHPFTVLDFILGSGGFSSRIVNIVRNNEGLAYSAGSFYLARPEYGFLGSYAFTKTSATMKTLSLMDSVIANILSEPVSKSELEWAKKSIQNGFIFSFSTPEQIVRQQMNVEFEKLPADFLTAYRDKIEKVTLADLSQVAAKYLKEGKAVIFILGDGKHFDSPSEKHGQFIILTPEE